MNSSRTFRDHTTDIKVVLAGMWVAMLFLFAYVDIFTFWRADAIHGALSGEIPGQGISINQAFLAATTGFIVIPSLMIVASLTLKASLNRKLNIVVSIIYATATAVLCIGETWIYYLLGSFFEVVLLLAIARIGWAWPRTSDATSDLRSPAGVCSQTPTLQVPADSARTGR